MQETEIQERLESLLGIEGLTIQVVIEEDDLLVILNRSGAAHLDYETIVAQVQEEIELNCMEFDSIQFYSRVMGEHDPDWARTVHLGPQPTGTATVIVSAARSAPTVIEDRREEEDISSKLPPTPTLVIDNSDTTIEEETFNLPKPKLHRPQPPKVEDSFTAPTLELPLHALPAEADEDDNSAPTQVAAPPPKPPQPEPPAPPPPPTPTFPKGIIAAVAVVVLLAIGGLIWSTSRPQQKTQPKKSQIGLIVLSKNSNLPISLHHVRT
jgi:hypothetical protein